MLTAGEDKDQQEQFEQERPWEVMDINFVTTDWTELDMLIEMDEIDRDKKRKIYAVQKLQETPEQAEDNAERLIRQMKSSWKCLINIMKSRSNILLFRKRNSMKSGP